MDGEVMKLRLLIALLICCAFALAGCVDVTSDPVMVSRTLGWTATGDDGSVGTASAYSLRYSINESDLTDNWVVCVEVPGLPAPKIAGTLENYTATVSLETGTTYHFALRVADEAGNWSTVSNRIAWTPLDTDAPLGIQDLHWVD
jgi:hypothetical protein